MSISVDLGRTLDLARFDISPFCTNLNGYRLTRVRFDMASKTSAKHNVDWRKLAKAKYTQICKQRRHKRVDDAKSAWDRNR